METRRVLRALVGVVSFASASLLGCAAGQDEAVPSPPAVATAPPLVPEPTSTLSEANVAEPPPISGGTLLVLKDGRTAVAADPDRDAVWVADLAGQGVLHAISLLSGDEPGRVVEDASGRVHVILRRGGALVSIDPAAGEILSRRPVCPAPRGIAYDAAKDALHVACLDGRLFTFPAAGGGPTSMFQLDGDLRDVIMQGDDLYVTRFRSAEILHVGPDGTIAQRIELPALVSTGPGGFVTSTPDVAWRAAALPGGGIAVLHQRAQDEAVATTPGGYDQQGACPGAGLVSDAITMVPPGTPPPVAGALAMMALAVDVAVSADGTLVAVASPTSGPNAVSMYWTSDLTNGSGCVLPTAPFDTSLQATSVAFYGQSVVAQVREPAELVTSSFVLPLRGPSAANVGHQIFHTATQAGIACASCHPEGGDDGRVWQFQDLGPRRTMNIRGGVLARAPFHWSGDIPDMDALVQEVLVGRMDGAPLDPAQTAALGAWMNAQPAILPPPPSDPSAALRGEHLFEDPSVGCAGCHSGPQLSDHQLFDVGTGETPGEPFKVPSLIAVGYRAPYLHNGCAATLQGRFSPACDGGGQHGNTQGLDADQIDDLVAYLESL